MTDALGERRELTSWHGEELSPIAAYDAIIHFAANYGPSATTLAAYCSVLESLCVETVGLMRQNFLRPSIRWQVHLDAHLLYGGLCCRLGDGLFRMEAEVRRQLLLSLEMWALRVGEEASPVKAAASLVRQFVAERRLQTVPRVDATRRCEHLNALDWVATGFVDPHIAASLLAKTIRSSLDESDTNASRLRLSRISGLLSLPLAEFDDLLAVARGVEAAQRGDFETARRLISPGETEPLEVGGVRLPTASELITRFGDGHNATISSPLSPESDFNGEKRAKLATPPDLTESTHQPLQDSSAYNAVLDNNVARLRKALDDNRLSARWRDTNGLNPAHIAAKQGKLECLDVILSAQPDLANTFGGNYTVLHLACAYGQIHVVRFLLQRDVDPSQPTETSQSTPIQIAANHGRADIVRLVAEQGGNVNEPRPDGMTSAHFALLTGRREMYELLLTLGFDVSNASIEKGGYSLIHCAASGGLVAPMFDIVEISSDVNQTAGKDNWTPLHIAAFQGHPVMVEALTELGADVEARIASGWTALHLAAQDHPEAQGTCAAALTMLATRGAKLNARVRLDGHTALSIAVANNHAEGVRALLDAGADPNLSVLGKLPLHDANDRLQSQSPRFVESLMVMINHPDTDINARDETGKTLIEKTLSYSEKDSGEHRNEIAHRLYADDRLDHNLRSADKGLSLVELAYVGKNPLFFEMICDPRIRLSDAEWLNLLGKALQQRVDGEKLDPKLDAMLKNDRTVDALLKADDRIEYLIMAQSPIAVRAMIALGLDPSLSDTAGSNYLHRVARNTNTVANMFVALDECRHLDINMSDSESRTPLMLACGNSSDEIIETMLERGADPRLADREGFTALHYAAERGSRILCERLINAGSDPLARAGESQDTPLERSILAGNEETTRTLIDTVVREGASTKSMAQLLLIAAEYGHAHIFALLGMRIKSVGLWEGVSKESVLERAYQVVLARTKIIESTEGIVPRTDTHLLEWLGHIRRGESVSLIIPAESNTKKPQGAARSKRLPNSGESSV